jgi:hypothetical protein
MTNGLFHQSCLYFITYSFMPLRQYLQYLILWKRKRKTPELIPHYTIDKPNPSTRLPNELLIEIINYHHDDRSTLYRLSLVSWDMRAIAQPLLFCQINDIRTMSSRAYIRFLRCRRKPYRHVLLFVRSFRIDFPLRNRPSLNNRDLLLSMSKVTHLTITLHHRNKKMGSILQHCSEAFRLEELTVISEMGLVEDIPIVTNFISEQKHLKRLTIEVHPDICLNFGLGALAQLEALCANWVQICNILPGRPLIKTVTITEDPWIPNIHIEPGLKRRLSHLHSVSVDVRILMILHLGDYLMDLEMLELTKTCGIFRECQIVSCLHIYPYQ